MGRSGRAFSMGVLLVVGIGCSPRTRPPAAASAVRSGPAAVAVLPFRVGGEMDQRAAFAERTDVPAVPDDIGDRIATLLGRDLARAGVSTVDAATVIEATPPPGTARYDGELAARVARNVGANLAVYGALTRFVEREGSAWGASTPATVWYQAVLVDVDTRAVIDRERFEYTQQPLSQNLLELPRFLQGGGRWVTRDEMLTGALGETAARLARAIRGIPPAALNRAPSVERGRARGWWEEDGDGVDPAAQTKPEGGTDREDACHPSGRVPGGTRVTAPREPDAPASRRPMRGGAAVRLLLRT